MCKDAVAKAFSADRNLECWAAVGAVPLTMKCLSDNNVWHNGNNKNDPEYDKFQIIQSKNDFSCTQLSTMGYDADLLKTGFNEDRIRAAAAEEELDLSVTAYAPGLSGAWYAHVLFAMTTLYLSSGMTHAR